ncbi:TolC family protein [Sphingobacterium spiritivorum]|uniref:TolC family protein n=1 Tax=Sphingobacterium spiritivorum TaxID=258 RepID=UPI00191B0700|nr:TolC family protein [Sphingobacterium spiritivorum]QQT26307.1 TolC family protein [Sphingobacterium spiritivorum]
MKFFKTGRLVLSMLLSGFITIPLQAQEILDAYVSEAFRNNIVLQQKDVSLEKAQYALKTARSLFLPTVAFQGAYQTADGGRNIPLPLGDLLNPIYSTLNQLTQSSQFPVMENQNINFLPKNFYDAKIRTTMPIINTDLTYNKRISEQQVVLQQFEVVIYKRDLVKNIKTAYYNYQSALQAVDIYKSGLQLANEGLRVNEKLLEGGKGLPAYVLRSRSEVEQANAQLVAAEQRVLNARMYFNFLLNRNAETNIDVNTDNKAGLDKVSTLLADLSLSEKREELKALDQVVEINRTALKMNKQYAVPKLAAFVDLGSQSEGFKFNNNTRYYMLGLQLDIPIFTAGRNDIKVRQSNLDLRNAELQVDLVTQQLNLATRTAQNNLKAVYQKYQSSLKQFEAASSYQRLIEKGYKAGTNTFIETIDARNQYTSAQLLVNINRYNVLSAMADLERETAAYLIP